MAMVKHTVDTLNDDDAYNHSTNNGDEETNGW